MKRTAFIIAIVLLTCLPLLSVSREEVLSRVQRSTRAILQFDLGSLPSGARPQRLSGYLEQSNWDGWVDTNALGLVFDAQGRITGWLTKIWNPEDQLWMWDWRVDVNYLPDGRYGRIDQYYYEEGWNPSGYSRFVWSGATVDSLNSYYIWDNMEFETSLIDFAYSPQNGYLESITEFNSMIDRYSYRQTFGYDVQGRLIAISVANSFDEVEWQDSSRQTLSYHPSDTSNYSQFYSYLIDSSVYNYWVYSQVSAPFRLSEVSGYYYDTETLQWILSDRDQSFYDQNDRLDHRDFSYYDQWEGFWVIWNRYTYSYNDDGLLTTVLVSSEDPDIGWWDYSRFNLIYENYSDADDPTQSAPLPALRAWPNPFNPSTTISFAQPSSGPASLTVYNLKGQRVKTLLSASDLAYGSHSIVWDGHDNNGRAVSSGLYFCRLSSQGKTSVIKLLLAK